jgi:hypothetical protein
MEKLMGNTLVKLHFPHYYLFPIEAKAKYTLVHGLKAKLHEVKGVQYKENLAYKGTLLNVGVSKDVVRVRALGKIFNINLMNINYVVQRHREIEVSRSS